MNTDIAKSEKRTVPTATDNTIPTAFGHFDDLIKSFVKESENVLGDIVQPDLPKMKKKQVGQTFSNPFFESRDGTI